MPRPPEQYEAMRTATRSRIESAATTLFATHGLAATNVRDIARAAGISTGLLYRHYAGKEDLFDSLIGQAAAGLGAVVDRFVTATAPGPTLTGFTTEFLIDLAGDSVYAEFFQLMTQWYALPDSAPGVRALREQHAAMFQAATDLVARGQELGELRTGSPRELVTCYLGTLSGLATMRVTLGDAFELPSTGTIIRLLVKEDP